MAKKKVKKTINNVNNDVSPILMVSIFVIFIIAMVFVTYFGMHLQYPASKYFSQYDEKIVNDLGNIISKQKEMDEKIKTLSQDGGYTFEDPLVIKNPYNFNKLSAIVIFNTNDETKVDLSINDEHKTTVEKSKNHIIPIYGLSQDGSNIIKLTLEDGSTKEIELVFEPYNFDTNGFEVKNAIGNGDIYYLVGNVNGNESILRGFSYHNNLIAYFDLKNITGLSVYKNKLAVTYNQNMNVLNDLRLDIDYLGRILNISTNTEEIDKEVNLKNSSVSYIGAPGYLYNEFISNYTLNELNINDNYSSRTNLDIKDYDSRLSGAIKYPDEFEVSYMGDYIAYSTNKDCELIVVGIDGDLASYKLDKKGIIRTNIKSDKALYVNVDGIVYSLKKTLINKG